MAKLLNRSSRSAANIYTKKYDVFQGVDFSRDASMVDDIHSPYAENLVSDMNGFPEKRIGWRTIKQFDGSINGIFHFGDAENGCTIIHVADKIYKLQNDDEQLLIEGIADNKSNGKYFKGKLCILTGNEYLVFDGEKCIRARDAEDMYAPITCVSKGSMYLTYGDDISDTTFLNWKNQGVWEDKNGNSVSFGVMPEGGSVNLVSGKRRNYFEYKGGVAAFILDSTIDAGARVTMRCISTGEEVFSVVFDKDIRQAYAVARDGESLNIDILNSMKEQTSPYAQYYARVGNSPKNNCGYVICNIKIQSLNGYTHIEGVDNFSIEFSHSVEGYEDRINKCRFLDVFENRVFFSGNPDYPNADWYSGVNDALFVPDINYTEIGMDSSAIMGYLRTGDKQAVLKSDGDGATTYMRSYDMLTNGDVVFPIRQGVSGIGAIAPYAVCTFLDDPVYLTRNGVYAIGVQDISSERALNIRSSRINKKLLEENNLDDALMCEWNGYLVLCVGGNAYVADSAQKEFPLNKTNTFEYEWYYWTNIPARVICEYGGELFFGTESGNLCKFNTDLKNDRGEFLAEAYSDDGEAIVAEWATNLSNDGDFMQKKTLIKTGSGVFLKSYNHSGVKVIVRTEKDFGKEVTSANTEMLDFRNAEREDYSFNTAPYTVVPFNTRIKKYSAIQIICRNDKLNHAFGIGGIVRRYFYGKKKK